jgi:predicted O-methyltransferase YrrM
LVRTAYRKLALRVPALRALGRLYGLLHGRPRRYRYLEELVERHGCRRFMEIGTGKGDSAVRMIEAAARRWDRSEIEYYGFDLFELLDREVAQKELTKIPPPMEDVQRRLETTGARIRLFRGNTNETLWAAAEALPTMDFVFIDGGHSIETIENDWHGVQGLMHERTVVLFDDYYADRLDMGARHLVESLDSSEYRVKVLPIQDVFRKPWGLLCVNMVLVVRQSDAVGAA